MINNFPIVSLIIVTYNAADFIIDCLLSVRNLKYNSFETIIVDNASIDKTSDIIELHFPSVRIIKSSENLGFAAGVNLGYSHSKGKYIALLNPDTKVNSNWLSKLVLAMEKDEKCGICASLMLQWGTQVVDTAGDGCTRAGKGYKIGHNQPASLYKESRDVFTACGGAALYRRNMLEKIGFFDPDYFLLHEDTDLGFRARLAGWTCKYVHNAVVYHRVSASIGYKSSLAVYHSVKNSDLVWLKNMPGIFLVLTAPEKFLSDLASFIYLGLIHRKYKEYLRAKFHVSQQIRKIIIKRKEIQELKKISNKQLWLMLPPFISLKHLKRLWQDKNNELKIARCRGDSNTATSKDFNNHTHP